MKSQESSKLLFSVAFVTLAVMHITKFIVFDAIGLTILALAIIPWASKWIESIRVGEFEAKFRELEKAVDETQKELDAFKSTYLGMEADYLECCLTFNEEASSVELNKLASTLKAKAKGLASLDFLVSKLPNQSVAFGLACAVHARPQYHLLTVLLELTDSIVSNPSILGFRLKTIYRLLMAIDEIVKLDRRNSQDLISVTQLNQIRATLNKLISHDICSKDDVAKKARAILARFEEK